MVAKMYGGPSGGFVRPDARRHYEDLVRQAFDALAADGTPPADLPYRFYVEYYLRGGVTREVETTGITPNIEPLYSIHLPAAARAVGWTGRRLHQLHLDILLATAPELAELPSPRSAGHRSSSTACRTPTLSASSRSPTPASSAPSAAADGRITSTSTAVTSSTPGPNHAIGDLVDLVMVEEVLAERRPMPGTGKLQLDNALGIAIWLSGEERARTDHGRGGPARCGGLKRATDLRLCVTAQGVGGGFCDTERRDGVF